MGEGVWGWGDGGKGGEDGLRAGVGGGSGVWCWSRRDTRGKRGYDGSLERGVTVGERRCGGRGVRGWREGWGAVRTVLEVV